MTPFLQLVLVLAIILFAAKTAAYLSTRLGQPAVLGELIVGLLLGPTLIDLTHMVIITDIHLSEIVAELGELGVLALMFLAGLELELRDLTKSGRVSALSGLLGVVAPVGLGLLVGEVSGMDFSHAMFLGLTLGATSVSISAQTLMEMKLLRSRVGLGLLGAAVSFAGAGTVTLADDGTGGDDAAGDGRYHGRWTVPAGFTLAAGLVTGTFTDAAGNRRQAAAPRFLTVYTPPAPVTATALATGPTTVALSWTSSLSSIFAAYRVYRSTSSGVGNEATLLTTITAQATTTYDDTGLTPGTTYYYRVDTVDRSGLAARSLVVSARPQ